MNQFHSIHEELGNKNHKLIRQQSSFILPLPFSTNSKSKQAAKQLRHSRAFIGDSSISSPARESKCAPTPGPYTTVRGVHCHGHCRGHCAASGALWPSASGTRSIDLAVPSVSGNEAGYRSLESPPRGASGSASDGALAALRRGTAHIGCCCIHRTDQKCCGQTRP